MGRLLDNVTRRLKAFLDNPLTDLFKGIALVVIGCAEAAETLVDDVTNKHLRLGHGLILIGFFGILEAMQKLLEGAEARRRYLERRSARTPEVRDAGDPTHSNREDTPVAEPARNTARR